MIERKVKLLAMCVVWWKYDHSVTVHIYESEIAVTQMDSLKKHQSVIRWTNEMKINKGNHIDNS